MTTPSQIKSRLARVEAKAPRKRTFMVHPGEVPPEARPGDELLPWLEPGDGPAFAVNTSISHEERLAQLE